MQITLHFIKRQDRRIARAVGIKIELLESSNKLIAKPRSIGVDRCVRKHLDLVVILGSNNVAVPNALDDAVDGFDLSLLILAKRIFVGRE
jgi:hypothetical protein